MITWLHPDDCDPPHGLNLSPGSRDSIKVAWLTEAFERNGFDKKYPALVGYPLEGRVQLLSGTHRHTAAKRAGILLPVTMFLRRYVEAYWGTDNWIRVLEDIAVEDLETMEGVETLVPGLSERVTL